MNKPRYAHISSMEADVPENSPLRLLEEYKRLTAEGKIRMTEGANYRLSGALRSNKVPTDRRLIGRRLSDVGRIR